MNRSFDALVLAATTKQALGRVLVERGHVERGRALEDEALAVARIRGHHRIERDAAAGGF